MVFALAALAPAVARAADPPSCLGGGCDGGTILPDEIPADAPRFADYPARVVPITRPAPAKIVGAQRWFRTRLREGAERGPNFAGHYTLATWGCGAGCVSWAVIDAVTGRVFDTSNMATTQNFNVADELAQHTVQYRLDSRLLVVIGEINENPKMRGISYFVWTGAQLDRVRFIAHPEP